MELYDLTLKKEVARECAWGIMGTINRIENKKINCKLFQSTIDFYI